MGFSLSLSGQNQKVRISGVSSQLIYEGSPCDAFPCWNGGTCIGIGHGHKRKWRRRDMANNNNSKGYMCQCRAQFEGKHCESRKAVGLLFNWTHSAHKLKQTQQENTTIADWCSTERQTCPVGMICVISNSADRQCLSIRALSVSPTEHLFPLPPLLLTFYGLFLFILLLLFCWAGNSSAGFFLLLRKRDKRGQWKKPTLTDQQRSEYEPILEEEEEGEEGIPIVELESDAIEMGQIRRKWDHRWSSGGKKKANDHWHGRTLFSVDGIRPKALKSDDNMPSIPKIEHI